MCFGTFDILHVGHLNYFRQAKKHGDYLIVVIARDQTKKAQKKATIFTEQERRELVENLKIVDEAVLGYSGDHFRIIREKKPEVLCLGYDHPLREEDVRKKLAAFGLHPQIYRMKSYKPKTQKSTFLKEFFLKKLH